MTESTYLPPSAEQLARWRAEWAREDEMLQFFDAEPLSCKALSQKFNLPYSRTCKLVQRHKQRKEAASQWEEIERLRARLKADTFEMKAERLWLDLAWLIQQLESANG